MSIPVFTDTVVKQMFTDTLAVTDVSLRLYSNDLTPTYATVFANLTQVSGFGYAAKTLSHLSWTISTTGPGALATYAIQTFTFTSGSFTAYGYYYTDTGNTKLQGPVVRFTTPFTVTSSANTILITPTVPGWGTVAV